MARNISSIDHLGRTIYRTPRGSWSTDQRDAARYEGLGLPRSISYGLGTAVLSAGGSAYCIDVTQNVVTEHGDCYHAPGCSCITGHDTKPHSGLTKRRCKRCAEQRQWLTVARVVEARKPKASAGRRAYCAAIYG